MNSKEHEPIQTAAYSLQLGTGNSRSPRTLANGENDIRNTEEALV